ncbi:MAG: response regulator [Bacteroidales bacterium]|nr:response regulator [Bacteroidales bacterium]
MNIENKSKATVPDITADLNNKTILVVDDEELNWLLIKANLEDTNAEIIWARLGQEAIDIVLSGKKIDLIFMDMKMPIMDGYETTRQIKLINNEIPIVAQTAYALQEEIKRCMESGCDDYISKPIDMQHFLELTYKYLQ